MAEWREPERTCVGCRARGRKRDLLRVVRAPDGSVAIDPGGKAAGRGAYVHPDAACLRRASRAGSLGRALRTPLDAPQAARLLAELAESATHGVGDGGRVNVRGDER